MNETAYSYTHYDFDSYVWSGKSSIYPNTKTSVIDFNKTKNRYNWIKSIDLSTIFIILSYHLFIDLIHIIVHGKVSRFKLFDLFGIVAGISSFLMWEVSKQGNLSRT